jgi:hypothetical protein
MIQSSELILNPDGSVPPEFKTGTYTTSFSCDQNRGKSHNFGTNKENSNPNGIQSKGRGIERKE